MAVAMVRQPSRRPGKDVASCPIHPAYRLPRASLLLLLRAVTMTECAEFSLSNYLHGPGDVLALMSLPATDLNRSSVVGLASRNQEMKQFRCPADTVDSSHLFPLNSPFHRTVRHLALSPTPPRKLTSILPGTANVTTLGSQSVSTNPMVGTLDAVHSLMAPRFSDGLRKMATSGRWEFAAMGPRPKLLFRRWTRGEEERVRLIPTGGKKGKKVRKGPKRWHRKNRNRISAVNG
jgi:hypothetical protein